MKAVIMQPTYLPWSGYFDLMDQSDIFVLLDNVQFSKHSWHQRNRIKTPQGELMLTIPIVRKFPQILNKVKINNSTDWKRKHLRAIELNYSKAKFFNDYFAEFKKLFSNDCSGLVEFTVPIILWIKEALGIECKILKSSEIDGQGSKTELIIDICKKIGADEYLSPPGSMEYIDECAHQEDLFAKNDLKLGYQNYFPSKYIQLWGEFIPYLSTIDLLFNEGKDSLSIIRNGRNQAK